jgi:transcriptional regulator of acetoin/glycerol metabolism
MSRSVVIMVSNNPDFVENNKKHFDGQDCHVQTYSPDQWRTGLDSPFFRQQLIQGVPALAGGSNSLGSTTPGQVLAFPTQDNSVLKMDHMEAKAIENAILQYKGNLTEAAKALGIGRATLYRKVKQYQIDPSVARKKKAMAA